MLSYMKDNEKPFDHSKEAGDNVEDQQVSPEKQQEYLAPAEVSRNVKQSTLILIVLVLVSAGGLYFMIKKTAPAPAAAAAMSKEEARLESAIAQLTGVRTQMASRMDEVVQRFCKYSEFEQVGKNELIKNPFSNDFNSIRIGVSNNENIDMAMIRRQDVQKRAMKLTLWTVLKGGNGA